MKKTNLALNYLKLARNKLNKKNINNLKKKVKKKIID